MVKRKLHPSNVKGRKLPLCPDRILNTRSQFAFTLFITRYRTTAALLCRPLHLMSSILWLTKLLVGECNGKSSP